MDLVLLSQNPAAKKILEKILQLVLFILVVAIGSGFLLGIGAIVGVFPGPSH